MKPILNTLIAAVLLLAAAPITLAQSETATYQSWIEQMKEAERGPFERLRWFCSDGSVLPPEPYACKDHGGGHQHGEWNDRTEALRE
ncbi:MAG: hypothetical protein P8X98_05195 [Woeseiaceae bacterium]